MHPDFVNLPDKQIYEERFSMDLDWKLQNPLSYTRFLETPCTQIFTKRQKMSSGCKNVTMP